MNTSNRTRLNQPDNSGYISCKYTKLRKLSNEIIITPLTSLVSLATGHPLRQNPGSLPRGGKQG